MKKNSLLYFIPFLVAIYDYDYFPVLAVISISIIYFTNNEITFKKSWLRFSFFSFLLVRLLSAINLTFTDTWVRISQKNYSLDYRFIDMQEAFMSLYCSQRGVHLWRETPTRIVTSMWGDGDRSAQDRRRWVKIEKDGAKIVITSSMTENAAKKQ